jgi:Family of unknown function (DUF6304)
MKRHTYPAVFEDQHGREATTILNDGHELRLSLRGVDFTGSDFDGLSPVAAHHAQAHTLFTLHRDELCAFRLQWAMPLELDHDGSPGVGVLSASLVLGDPLPNGSLSSQELRLSLTTPAGTVHGSGRSGWFEDELVHICQALTAATRIRSCFTCAFSDYSPCGHGLFGSLACFRGVKDKYLQVRDKEGIFDIWDHMTEFVQETYLCGEFKQRVPGAGYRG